MNGQSLLDVSTGFENEGYLIPMLILFCADDIDSKFLIDPQRDVLLFIPHVSTVLCTALFNSSGVIGKTRPCTPWC